MDILLVLYRIICIEVLNYLIFIDNRLEFGFPVFQIFMLPHQPDSMAT